MHAGGDHLCAAARKQRRVSDAFLGLNAARATDSINATDAALSTPRTPLACSQILGEAPLPWETTRLRKRPVPELRMLQRSVLSCLNRDPLRRPSAAEVLQAWDNLFDAVTKGSLPAVGDDATSDDGGRSAPSVAGPSGRNPSGAGWS